MWSRYMESDEFIVYLQDTDRILYCFPAYACYGMSFSSTWRQPLINTSYVCIYLRTAVAVRSHLPRRSKLLRHIPLQVALHSQHWWQENRLEKSPEQVILKYPLCSRINLPSSGFTLACIFENAVRWWEHWPGSLETPVPLRSPLHRLRCQVQISSLNEKHDPDRLEGPSIPQNPILSLSVFFCQEYE